MMKLQGFKEALEDETIYRPDQVEEVIKKVRTNFRFHRSNTKHKYFNVPAALDLETSSFYDKDGEKVGIMYVWMLGIYGLVIMGRIWDEFTETLNRVSEILDLNENKRLMIYVHNLQFDFQFFRHHFNWDKVFASDRRQPLYALTDTGIEFRCSYQLSGMSLAKVGENLLTYKVKKMVGDLDYKKIRHSKTRLTKKEKGYGVADVKVVMAFIAEEIERENGAGRLPLTKTGYVRKYCRNQIFIDPETGLKDKKKGRRFREYISLCTLTPTIYEKTRDAFMGGFTHANCLYVGQTVDAAECGPISSYDFTSSYPSVMVAERGFPVGTPIEVDTKGMSKDQFYELIHYYACIFTIHFFGIREKPEVYENYISRSKCRYVTKDVVTNNGRVVSASELMVTITEVDFEIINALYDYDGFEISYLVYWHRGYLPTDFVKAILNLYKAKTELKGVAGKEVEYQVSKGMINACYGMAVTRVIREQNNYSDDWEIPFTPDPESEINRYNKQNGRFLYFPQGVYVTSFARRNLFFGGILEAGEDYLYSDTDSIKLLHREKHGAFFEQYNRDVIKKIETACEYHGIDPEYIRPKTIKGVEKPLGVWDYEGDMARFKTLGAKRYLIEEMDGSLSLTVSGVNKKIAVPYLKKVYHSNTNIFNAFKDGLTIPAGYSGKSTHTYIDDEKSGLVTDYRGQTIPYCERSGIHLEETTYHMGISGEFLDYLKSIMKGL